MGDSVGDFLENNAGRPVDVVVRANRRQFLLHAGRGSLAIAVLGLGACSTSPPKEPPGKADQTSGPEPHPAAALWWERVNLGAVSAYVLLRGNKAAVVDTGQAGSAEAIAEVLRAAGADWDAVSDVVLTHNHPDHAGSVGEVLSRARKATVHVGEADSDQIPGAVSVAKDGADIFGLQVIATPGHTLGHISVYDAQMRILIAGDALTNTAGLSGSNPTYTADAGLAAASVKRLAELDVQTLLFGHGYPLRRGVQASLQELAASL